MTDAHDRTITAEQARRLDRLAIDRLGVPGVVLMENAAINAAAILLDQLDDRLDLPPHRLTACIACGPGNNGGDGYAIARHLHNWGVDARLYAARSIERLHGDAATNARICRGLGLPIHDTPDADAWSDAHLLVDALLGTGFEDDAVRPPLDAWIEAINAADPALCASLDAPSGLHVDTGHACPTTVRADLTITFAAAKPGLVIDAAAAWVGRLFVADIGLPDRLLDGL
jgi:NAD(P)H-hydrate epimerase